MMPPISPKPRVGQTPFDRVVEEAAFDRNPDVTLECHNLGLNFNRLIAVRMGYLYNQFTEFPDTDD